MATVNKVIFIGRLTREPECRTFSTGGKMASFGFAVSNRRRNQQTGQWEDEPMFIDCKVFNRGDNGKKADLVEQYLHKGNQVYLEGRLHLEQWDDKTSGQKRSKHVLYVDDFQFLEPRQDGGGGAGSSGGGYQRRSGPPASAPTEPAFDEMDSSAGPGSKDSQDDIPF
jgi:single-strand DNA-binding protein